MCVRSPCSKRKPRGTFIHAFAVTMKNADAIPASATGTAGEPVRARREAVPAVEVDAEEDRLEEERDPLERERQADDPARDLTEPRPQQPELERDDRARDRADREQDGERLGPATGQGEPGRVAGPQVQALGGQHHHRQADAEDGEG